MTEPKPENKEERKPATAEEMLSKLAADTYENRKAINAIAEILAKMRGELDALKGGGATNGGGGGGAPPEALTALLASLGLAGKKETPLEDVAKTAESLAKVAENLDRFRSRGISPAEALLMRAGLDRLRHPMPRYMTKEEMRRYEKLLGIAGVEEEEEEQEGGEDSEH